MIQNLVLLIRNGGFYLKPVCVFYTCNIIYVLCWFQTYDFYRSIEGSPWDFLNIDYEADPGQQCRLAHRCPKVESVVPTLGQR